MTVLRHCITNSPHPRRPRDSAEQPRQRHHFAAGCTASTCSHTSTPRSCTPAQALISGSQQKLGVTSTHYSWKSVLYSRGTFTGTLAYGTVEVKPYTQWYFHSTIEVTPYTRCHTQYHALDTVYMEQYRVYTPNHILVKLIVHS